MKFDNLLSKHIAYQYITFQVLIQLTIRNVMEFFNHVQLTQGEISGILVYFVHASPVWFSHAGAGIYSYVYVATYYRIHLL